ncbi:FMN-binding negative transcriptional regulator [Luteimonas sp. RD2P54]|uniref:FMN-binding negative transcriptional regulator n=1 Tax=Luteimonas endophytica TaxID=3042023 RepID=A0ABT6J8M7_9GAMM|nr:FMN-binding negative transcriptional regulator [Luteimonas endophytica]MDH5823171.1 FMN-binding negative transcriptional regulator [Luteimonas endophytica]
MYTPHAFAESDLAQLDRLVDADPFVTLVTTAADGLPFASHLPVLYRRDADRVLVEGHWARPNPQAAEGQALLIVHGPHAYVSPGWYPDKEPAARVPTWNYAAAHLYGALECYEDDAALGDLVLRLSERFEARAGSDWSFDPTEPRFAAQLRGITGFRFRPSRVELKFKLHQNHPQANREAVATELAAAGGDDARAVAALMHGRLPGRPAP